MSKKYREALEKVDRTSEYQPKEAIELLKEISYANFDETVELHLRLNIDTRYPDQNIRTTLMLPHGTGKEVKVLVFAEGEGARLAEEAGADYVADEQIINRIKNEGWVDFDTALATPDQMRKVGPLGKVLGRRGLMPNPKAGTVVPPDDIPRAIEEAKAGRMEFRNDKTGNVHLILGKMSFDTDQLVENMSAAMESVIKGRPPGVKGQFVRRVSVSGTMTPGIRIDYNTAITMF